MIQINEEQSEFAQNWSLLCSTRDRAEAHLLR